jgi:hypothetical protein
MSACNTVSSYNVDVQEVQNTGRCVKFYCDTLERFLYEKDNLIFSFEFPVGIFKTVSTKTQNLFRHLTHHNYKQV